jgi:hypothetical protein
MAVENGWELHRAGQKAAKTAETLKKRQKSPSPPVSSHGTMGKIHGNDMRT